MRLIIKLLIAAVLGLGLISQASAVSQGAYLGMDVGATNTHNQVTNVNSQTTNVVTGAIISTASTPTQPSNNGFGFRVFTGYNFNPYFALEGGWAHYGPSTFDAGATSCNSSNTVFVTPCNSPTIRTNGFDFEGKGIAQLPYFGLGVFAKLGFAAFQISYAGSLITDNTSQNGSGSSIRARPLVGVGISYDMTQSWQFDLSVTRILKGSGIQNADFASLGFSYHFVDTQCGQFLC